MEKSIKKRMLGDIAVSPVALGTMRFVDKGVAEKELVQLFSFLYDEMGIDVHHSSYEYSSYALYCNALAAFKKKAASTSNIYASCRRLILKKAIFQRLHLPEKYITN